MKGWTAGEVATVVVVLALLVVAILTSIPLAIRDWGFVSEWWAGS